MSVAPVFVHRVHKDVVNFMSKHKKKTVYVSVLMSFYYRACLDGQVFPWCVCVCVQGFSFFFHVCMSSVSTNQAEMTVIN